MKSNCAVNYMGKMLKGARGMAFDFAKSEHLAGGGTNWGRVRAIGNRLAADSKANPGWMTAGSLVGAGVGAYGGYKAGGAVSNDNTWGKIGGGLLGAAGGFAVGSNIGGSLGPGGLLRNAGIAGYGAAKRRGMATGAYRSYARGAGLMGEGMEGPMMPLTSQIYRGMGSVGRDSYRRGVNAYRGSSSFGGFARGARGFAGPGF